MPPECSELAHGLECPNAMYRLCPECGNRHNVCNPWLINAYDNPMALTCRRVRALTGNVV
jgi:hypothetical protein